METVQDQYRRLIAENRRDEMRDQVRRVVIDKDVPLVETRGRPCSDEYVKLLMMDIGDSFTSKKSRDTLYQIARNLGIKVSIKSAARKGWRVWKMGPRVLRRGRKALISAEVENYIIPHGREIHKTRD